MLTERTRTIIARLIYELEILATGDQERRRIIREAKVQYDRGDFTSLIQLFSSSFVRDKEIDILLRDLVDKTAHSSD
ncbi:MAG: hypothetical protein KW793_00680 [Candidatus Doudnabacteria bacterium]|nr:hypothetical protein [Candidatus Doudnabacteria bacterium]